MEPNTKKDIEALDDLKKYLISANIQDDENWRIRTLLNRLGLTKYEAEAYIGLVQGGTLTVKQLVQKTGIPQSRSYDTLGSLVKYGMVEQTPQIEKKGKQDKRFRAVGPDLAVHNLFSYFTYIKDEAIAELQKIEAKKNKKSQIWEIFGKKNIIMAAKNLIKGTQFEILIIANLKMLKSLKEELLEAEKRGINITCITEQPKKSDQEVEINWGEFFRIEKIIQIPMPFIINDYKKALVWGHETFEQDVSSDYVVAQFIEGREWVSTLADNFFITHWNLAKPFYPENPKENMIFPKTFVHIQTALDGAKYLLNKKMIPYADVVGTNSKKMSISVSGEIVDIKEDWNEGISTIIIRPNDSKKDVQVTVGGKYAAFEDIRMEKITINTMKERN
ncbi:HTH-type sugar sensing transcriptional regulator TrmBL1 [Candidatus Lokiarchaeum ossiferum]|uniref:HTH-type sugar sensing transcriptional regulator TrmBL1 n=1 Tax=Candidatus Lokiarchaeum ossiferum TaxID=2951803 RepID=A0ABY6HRA7_9ARCH|nr:HTH-type sugar sensing transcriptional regulator TrmBL1 [Candidatus Lokiarchaeum sp. B-35]